VDNPLFHAVKLTEGDELEVASHPEEMRMVEEFKAQFTSFANPKMALRYKRSVPNVK